MKLNEIQTDLRNELLYREWRNRIYRLSDIAKAFKISVQQAYNIIKAKELELQAKVYEKFNKK
jgi:Mor family transcriptional regulator